MKKKYRVLISTSVEVEAGDEQDAEDKAFDYCKENPDIFNPKEIAMEVEEITN